MLPTFLGELKAHKEQESVLEDSTTSTASILSNAVEPDLPEGVLEDSAVSTDSALSNAVEPDLQELQEDLSEAEPDLPEGILEDSTTATASTLSSAAEPDLQVPPEALSDKASAQEESVESLLDQSQAEQDGEPLPQQDERPLFDFFNKQPGLEPATLDTEAFFLFLADQKGFLEVEPLASQYAAL
ncbi:MAG TPA: hypothetical protein VFV38_46560, partial [Ktedonobacteraceae bacterium]|nr:hypothetical protein [Ktedonobacteraceae bacterium]